MSILLQKDRIGIIAGSGLENAELIDQSREKIVKTDYGFVQIVTGFHNDREIVFVRRHGKNHAMPPHEVNYRANIQALKLEGCRYIIATTACGSLREHLEPGSFVIPDQMIDWTTKRDNTFHDLFEPGKAVHVSMGDPYDSVLREKLIKACNIMAVPVHDKATLITIEGPRFSTRAESMLFRGIGADIINMSTATEAALAKEMGLNYAIVAMVTDYDSWKIDKSVTWEEVLDNFHRNTNKMVGILKFAVEGLE